MLQGDRYNGQGKQLFNVVETPCQHFPPYCMCVAFSALFFFLKKKKKIFKIMQYNLHIHSHCLGLKFETADLLLAYSFVLHTQAGNVSLAYYFNYSHANIVSGLSVDHLSINTTRLNTGYCKAQSLMVTHLSILVISFQVLQHLKTCRNDD